MKDQSAQLQAFKYCLITGFLKLEDLKKWADNLIARGDDSYFLIDLSMVKDVNQATSILNENVKVENYQQFFIEYLKVMNTYYKANTAKFEAIVRALFRAAVDYYDKVDIDILGEIYRLDDGIDLARQGIIGKLDEVEKDLKTFLGKYK